ncbi:ATP-binding protein [Limibacillus halophilus]|jgi:two-component system osmolarity sensor histidine kinase EnvZ
MSVGENSQSKEGLAAASGEEGEKQRAPFWRRWRIDWRDPLGVAPFLKRNLPRSLLGRAMLIMVSPLILVQIITAFIFYDRHYDHITDNLSRALASEIALITEQLLREQDPERRAEIFELNETLFRFDLSFQEHVTLPPDNVPRNTYLTNKMRTALHNRVTFNFTMNTEEADRDVVVYVQMLDGVLRVQIARQRLFSSSSAIFVGWMVGSSIILFAVAMVFMRNQVRPIRRLAAAAERFGKGRDTPGFKPEGATEVRQAAGAFIQMRERIKRQIRQRTEMLAGVSHDLRTPLTRMKLSLALMGDGAEVEELKSDVLEMERMVEGYLAFARGEGSESVRATPLGKLVGEVVEQARREAPARGGKTVDLHIEEEISLPLRRSSFRRGLQNVIGNALRHGQNVVVRVARQEKRALITIDDDGPGIPEAQREDVFKPFFRLDSSRNPETGGTGLGLTIARDAVRSQGGELRLEESPSKGLRVRISLPL